MNDMFYSPKSTRRVDRFGNQENSPKSSIGVKSMRSMKNVPDHLHKAQVFEFYFYPEYSIKTDKLRVDDPDKI